jgi:uncharacterized protein YjbJ (UPF0337 family)
MCYLAGMHEAIDPCIFETKIFKRRLLMNDDILKGQWKQIRGKAKEWWGKLTDDDLDKVNGRMDQIVGKLQERYGYSKDEATKEVNKRLSEFDQSPH